MRFGHGKRGHTARTDFADIWVGSHVSSSGTPPFLDKTVLRFFDDSFQCFGHISGGHINPAVTVAAAIMGQTPLVSVPFYVVGQFAGGLAGYALLMVFILSCLNTVMSYDYL